MFNETIKVPRGTTLTIIGDIHEQKTHFNKLIELAKPSDTNWIVSVGDIYDRGHGREAGDEIIRELQRLGAYCVRGNHEHKRRKREELSKEESLASNFPLSLTFLFDNHTKIVVLHGGITPKHSMKDLVHNSEIVYVRNLDEDNKSIPLKKINEDGKWVWKPKRPGKPWHEKYYGRFGYIVAGHEPQYNGEPKFYDYSANIDTGCFETGVLTGVVFDRDGRKDVLQVKEEPFIPKQ